MKGMLTGCVVVALSAVAVDSFAPLPQSTRLALATPSAFPRPSRLFMAESSLQDNNNNDFEPQLEMLQNQSMNDYFESPQLDVPYDGQVRQWDTNAIINYGILFGLGALIFAKLTLTDADVSRGWTAAEMAHHLPMDLWSSYSSVLQSSPISTKAVTSATVYTIGDILAQQSEGKSMGEIDRARTLRSLLAGLIGHGPLSHCWYNFSENLFDNVLHWTAWWSVAPKVVLDQSFWGPIWNNTYIILLGLMKRESLDTIWQDMKRTTIPLVVSGLKLWPLAHIVTYAVVPVENRLLWVDLVEILWVTILASQAAGGGDAHGLAGAALAAEEEEKVAFHS